VSRSAKPRRDPIADGPAEVVISHRELVAGGFHSYERFRFRLATADTPQTRDILRSGSVVAVLPVDLERDEIVLLQQFRLAAHVANGKGNLIEIVAGYVEKNESPIAAARRECIEELGVAPGALSELFTYFTSPGMSDEQITLFLGVVDAARIPPETPAKRLPQYTADCILRRPQEAVLTDLPPKIVRDTYLELTPAHRAAYNLAESDGMVRLNGLGESI